MTNLLRRFQWWLICFFWPWRKGAGVMAEWIDDVWREAKLR